MPGAPVHRRPTRQIENIGVQEVARGLAFATHALRREPNLHVTIHWGLVAGDMDIPTRIVRFMNRMAVWLRKQRPADLGPDEPLFPVVWAYVRESASQKGEHLHLYVHVPHALVGTRDGMKRLTSLFAGWVSADGALTETPRSRAVHLEAVLTPFRRRDIRGYLLKEAQALALERHNIPTTHTAKATGAIILGKRVAVSRAIGRASRQAYFKSAEGGHWLDPSTSTPTKGE